MIRPKTQTPNVALTRKGARRRADIPARVLSALNAGRIETANLMEWLAVDMALLLRNVLPSLGLDGLRTDVLRSVESCADAGVIRRLQLIGMALDSAISRHPRPEAVVAAIATHGSDIVRQWGCYIVAADRRLTLADRLEATKPFAADRNMSVRECAWMAFRPFLIEDLHEGMTLLRPLVLDPNPYIRRFAIEATRPRSVWGAHIRELKARPDLGVELLLPVRDDPSVYVRTALANWLNDASKTQPAWVRSVCREWERGASKPRRWVIRRALRSIRSSRTKKTKA
jgi:3-methyladenine DNA glycosylase AlkC